MRKPKKSREPLLWPLKRLVGNYASRATRAAAQLPIFRSRTFRRLAFDTATAGNLLLVQSQETFVVSTRDKIIGREMYTTGLPYDFRKMYTVLGIVPNNKTLLIDIGANIGTICIPAVKRRLFQNAVAIEPEPRNFSLLSANIHLNSLADKIVAHNLALGPQAGQQILFELSGSNFGDHRVLTNNGPGAADDECRETIVVRCESLDSVIKDALHDALIWMDTQGFEGHILKGARAAIQARVPICLEFCPHALRRTKGFQLVREALLSGSYQTLYDLGDQNPQKLTGDCLDTLYRKYEDDEFTDLLVV